MCLISKKNVPNVAICRIKCYKVLIEKNGKLVTPYQDFVVDARHGYVQYALEEEAIYKSITDAGYFIDEGFVHTFAKIGRRELDSMPTFGHKMMIWECYIPKGGEYFVEESMSGEIEAYASKSLCYLRDVTKNI